MFCASRSSGHSHNTSIPDTVKVRRDIFHYDWFVLPPRSSIQRASATISAVMEIRSIARGIHKVYDDKVYLVTRDTLN